MKTQDEFIKYWTAADIFLKEKLICEDEVLKETRESGSETTLPGAEVSPIQGRLLNVLAMATKAKKVLEIGTLAGYSGIWLARALGPLGKVVTLEMESQNAKVARENFIKAGVSENIEILTGDAIKSIEELIKRGENDFDLVFIDADKKNNPQYLEAAVQLTKPGSLIIVDNIVKNGAVLNEDTEDPNIQGIQKMFEIIKGMKILHSAPLQTVGEKGWDGLLIIYRE